MTISLHIPIAFPWYGLANATALKAQATNHVNHGLLKGLFELDVGMQSSLLSSF